MCERGKHGHFHSQTFLVYQGSKSNLDGIEPKVLGEAMSVGSGDPISDPFFSFGVHSRVSHITSLSFIFLIYKVDEGGS